MATNKIWLSLSRASYTMCMGGRGCTNTSRPRHSFAGVLRCFTLRMTRLSWQVEQPPTRRLFRRVQQNYLVRNLVLPNSGNNESRRPLIAEVIGRSTFDAELAGFHIAALSSPRPRLGSLVANCWRHHFSQNTG